MRIKTDCQNKTVTFIAVKNTTKIATKILQGNSVIQNVLTSLNHTQPFRKFPVAHVNQKYENRLIHVKVTSEDKVSPFIN